MTRRLPRVYGAAPRSSVVATGAAIEDKAQEGHVLVQLGWYALLLGVAVFIAVKVSP